MLNDYRKSLKVGSKFLPFLFNFLTLVFAITFNTTFVFKTKSCFEQKPHKIALNLFLHKFVKNTSCVRKKSTLNVSYFLTKKVKRNFLHLQCIPRKLLIQSIVQNVNTTIDL